MKIIYLKLIVFAAIYNFFGSELSIASTLELPSVNPHVVEVGNNTNVTISIKIDDPKHLTNSAILFQVNENNKIRSLIGFMKDNGIKGDLIGDDKTYTIQFKIKPKQIGVYRFQVFTLFRNERKLHLPVPIYSEVIGIFAVNNPSSVESLTESYVDSLPDGIPSLEELSHPGIPTGPIPDEIASSIGTLTNSPELVVFGIGSLVLLGFAIPNVEAFDGAIALMDVLEEAGIDTQSLTQSLINTEFHRSGLEAGNVALFSPNIAVTFVPGEGRFFTCIPPFFICWISNNTSQNHIILADSSEQPILSNLISQRFFSQSGPILDSATTVVHELIHAIIFRTGCFTDFSNEENIVSQIEILVGAMVNVHNLVGTAKDLAEEQRQEALNTVIAIGGQECLEELGITDLPDTCIDSDVEFISFVEGDPGIPGDGVFHFIGTVEPIPPTMNFQPPELNPHFSLNGVINGVTVTIFPKEDIVPYFQQGNPLNLSPSFRLGFPTICGFSSFGFPNPSGQITFNGVTGFVYNLSQEFLESLVNNINESNPGCVTLDQLSFDSLGLLSYSIPFGYVVIPFDVNLDALAIGLGQNACPNEQ